MMNGKKTERNVRWSSSKPSVKNMERNGNTGSWDREADRLAERRDQFIKKENKKKERQLEKAREKETKLWTNQADRELDRRDRFLEKLEEKNMERLNRARARETSVWERSSENELERQRNFMDRFHTKATRARERKEFLKWQKEIRANERRIRKLIPFKVVRTFTNANARFTTYFDTYKVYIYGPTDPVAVFQKAINLTIEDRGLVQGDKIRIIVSHPSWAHPFSTKLITITNDEQFFYTLLKSVLEYVEYKDVPLNRVTIEVQSTKIPRGQGRLTITKDNTSRKNCIITVKNTDTTCLARAIVTAHANLNKDQWTKSQIKNGFNDSRLLQKTQALKLHEDAGVPISDYGGTLEDVNTFANHLGIQINVVDTDYFNEIIHTANPESTNIIYLHKNKNHYDVVTSMTASLSKKYYCHTCKKGYTHRDKHKCPNKCLACFKAEKHVGDNIVCKYCNRVFFGQKCHDEHLRNRSHGGKRDVICKHVKKCLACNRTVPDLEQHVCGYSTCSNCKKYCDPKTHKCYMLSVETKGGACTRGETQCTGKRKGWCLCCKTRTTNYMFYDFETQQDTGTHIVNYVNAQDFDGNEYTFHTINDFRKFVFNDEHVGYTFIAHNAKSFNAQFILKYCVDNTIKPFCIYNGTKIMFMAIQKYNRRFIDSINFVNGALGTFPKTFGLTELKKGYFLHLFNTPGNQDYVGSIPAKHYYDPDHMNPEKRSKFLKWYNERVAEKYVFNFKNELVAYCRSDVDILRRSAITFRGNFLKIGNIDPLQYITIASVCITIYRSNYMPKNTIGVIKDGVKNETFSKISIQWLNWQSSIL